MPLTGRGVYRRKGLAEEARSLDMTFLRKIGFFRCEAGKVWNCSWTSRGEPSGTVGYWREDYLGEPFLLWFSYKAKNDGEEWREVKYHVAIESTRCHFGGLRHWFICPLVVDGRACGRRCRCLYLAGTSGYFGCRECHRLTYQSRRNHREMFWELFGKHREYVENAGKKYRSPRGLIAKERRAHRIAIATLRMNHGLAALPFPF